MNEQDEVQRSIGRMEGKMDLMVQSMQALAASFDNLEKGRLSTLEIRFASLQQETKDKSRSVAFWSSTAVSLIITIGGGVIVWYLTSKPH